MKQVCLVLVHMVAVLDALKAYDYYLILTFPPAIPDKVADRETMRTGELYLYTGIHTQPHMSAALSSGSW
jgi:hypothetical protein